MTIKFVFCVLYLKNKQTNKQKVAKTWGKQLKYNLKTQQDNFS